MDISLVHKFRLAPKDRPYFMALPGFLLRGMDGNAGRLEYKLLKSAIISYATSKSEIIPAFPGRGEIKSGA
ncbi:MAG: hypothetical protein QY316_02690 [Thermodesulfobacteriota bacterium]|nr:MAG: hypothetical protein QY316_02690 [Thermodesulfobacteriota bacterium]